MSTLPVRWLGYPCLALLVATLWSAAPAAAVNTVYLMNDDHVDYGWNDTVSNYEASILGELDFYRSRVDATAGNPPAEQTHFNCDGWFAVWLYQHNRSAAQFQDLINKMLSGQITAPLNPMVTLYGALPTEAAIRAGYYPGKLERQYGLAFPLAQDIENATSPWGVASIWAGSRAKYTWKGICGCASAGTYANRNQEVFQWQGPDSKTLLMKWYYLSDSQSWGGYAEARQNLAQPAIQSSINHFLNQSPFLPITGLFGGGWDDVSWQSSAFETVAHQWNAAHVGGDRVRVSNGIDYFQDLENYVGQLTTLRGGWGNEWELWSATLGERTAQTRRAIERLHTAEGLAAIVHRSDPSLWQPLQSAMESALVDYFRYFEHTWGVAGAVPLGTVIANKKLWAQNIDDAVSNTETAAAASFAVLLTTPNTEDRFVVFNPLGFNRTDDADLPIAGGGPYIVTDVLTGTQVPNQVVNLGGSAYLRIVASNVPSLGYRVYHYQSGTGTVFPPAAAVAGNQIESDHYRVTLGTRGQLSSVVDKTAMPNRELAGAAALNDFGTGSSAGLIIENAGPVSVTLRRDVSGIPSRRVRVTLIKDVDRIEVEDEILENYTSTAQYRYAVNLAGAQLRFEEVGAIARPGFTPAGDFLPGTRADYMTLNHFVTFASSGYTVTLSNWDAFAMQVGNSTPSTFDLSLPQVSVLASGNPVGADIRNQGGDAYTLDRFALRGSSTTYSGSGALQMSLAHQNPLKAIALARNQSGPLTAATQSLLSVSAPNVQITAFKPAEEGSRGWIVRLWEVDGSATSFTIDASMFSPTTATAVSLIETDTTPTTINAGVIAASIGANEIKAYRFASSAAAPTATASASQTPIPPTPTFTTTQTATTSPTPTSSPTCSNTSTPPASVTPTATVPTQTATAAGTSTTETTTPTQSPPLPEDTGTATPNAPPTDTPFPTPSPTNTVIVGLSGQVRYYGNGAPVSAVSIAVQGPVATTLQTDVNGSFGVLVAAGGPWRIEPQKTGDAGDGITALDASHALQAAVGLLSVTAPQRLACDANGSGTLTAIDASLILQFRVGLISRLPVSQACGSDWAFVPAPAPVPNQIITGPQLAPSCQMGAISFDPLATDAANQDFNAVLFGDCSGSWQPASGGGGGAAAHDLRAVTSLRLGATRRSRDGSVRVPIVLGAPQAIHAMEIVLRYDRTRMRLRTLHRAHGARGALLAMRERQPGVVVVALASGAPIQNGPLLVARFDTLRPLRPQVLRIVRARAQ